MNIVNAAVLVLSLTVSFVSASNVCGNVFVWHNNNMTCPGANTVCADVFDSMRDWQNGTTCEERRIQHNCKCSGNQICPTDDPAHRLYASRTQTRYMCQPACNLPWCERHSDVYPMTKVKSGLNFGRRAYNKMGCRCPRHHSPDMRRGIHRSTRMGPAAWDFDLNSDLRHFVCIWPHTQTRDPCVAQ